GHVTGVQTCALPISVDVAGGADTGAYRVSVAVPPADGFTAPTYDPDGTATAATTLLGLTTAAPADPAANFGDRGTGSVGSLLWRSEERRVGKEAARR